MSFMVCGRFEAAPVAARRGVDDRVVYGVKRDHAVPVRDRPVHDRDAVRRVRVRGDERREVPVDARLRLDQHGVVDHVEREPLERVVGVAESEVRPDLQHGTARAPRRRPGGTAWPGGGAAVCYGGGRRRGFGRCGSGSASPGSWLRSSAPTAAASSIALCAALIIHPVAPSVCCHFCCIVSCLSVRPRYCSIWLLVSEFVRCNSQFLGRK